MWETALPHTQAWRTTAGEFFGVDFLILVDEGEKRLSPEKADVSSRAQKGGARVSNAEKGRARASSTHREIWDKLLDPKGSIKEELLMISLLWPRDREQCMGAEKSLSVPPRHRSHGTRLPGFRYWRGLSISSFIGRSHTYSSSTGMSIPWSRGEETKPLPERDYLLLPPPPPEGEYLLLPPPPPEELQLPPAIASLGYAPAVASQGNAPALSCIAWGCQSCTT
ncbi:UNVERIFIED_CONTAM: hypothetical protein FKN15_053504 [Acipenser sinensis]